MAEHSIGEVAKLANVSIRTLHHYDHIGLLQPSIRGQSGYRFYTSNDLTRLHHILFFRALGLSLNEIATLLESNSKERMPMLLMQKQRIDQHIERLHKMRNELEKTIKEEEQEMNTIDDFSSMNGFDPDQYEQEAKQKWGQTDAYKESARRTKKYSKEEWVQYKAEHDALNTLLIQVMDAQLPADSIEATAIAEKMRLQIDQWFYPCSHEMHCQLAEMYIQDPGFTENYEKQRAGMAVFLNKAIKSNSCARQANGKQEKS